MSRFWAGLGIKLLGKADYYREIPEIREKGRGVSKFYSPRGGGGMGQSIFIKQPSPIHPADCARPTPVSA